MEYCGLYFCLVAKTKQKEIADKKCEHIYNGYIKQPCKVQNCISCQ